MSRSKKTISDAFARVSGALHLQTTLPQFNSVFETMIIRKKEHWLRMLLYGGDPIADEIEEPFGTDTNDLALSSMCEIIETTLLELVEQHVEITRKNAQGFVE